MKKLMLAICLLFGGVAVVNAQQDTTSTPTKTQTATQDKDRQQIQVSELPEAVRTSLQTQDYQGWAISAAYRSTQTDASDETKSMEVYVVELKNGAETKTAKFDKDGKKLDDGNGQKDQRK
jgi:hypothetical protein